MPSYTHGTTSAAILVQPGDLAAACDDSLFNITPAAGTGFRQHGNHRRARKKPLGPKAGRLEVVN
jgi:hypothetical protein